MPEDNRARCTESDLEAGRSHRANDTRAAPLQPVPDSPRSNSYARGLPKAAQAQWSRAPLHPKLRPRANDRSKPGLDLSPAILVVVILLGSAPERHHVGELEMLSTDQLFDEGQREDVLQDGKGLW